MSFGDLNIVSYADNVKFLGKREYPCVRIVLLSVKDPDTIMMKGSTHIMEPAAKRRYDIASNILVPVDFLIVFGADGSKSKSFDILLSFLRIMRIRGFFS